MQGLSPEFVSKGFETRSCVKRRAPATVDSNVRGRSNLIFGLPLIDRLARRPWNVVMLAPLVRARGQNPGFECSEVTEFAIARRR
jgi:hypothetical protein